MNKKDKLDLFEVEKAIEFNIRERCRVMRTLIALEEELTSLEKARHKLEVHKTTLMIKLNEEESNNG